MCKKCNQSTHSMPVSLETTVGSEVLRGPTSHDQWTDSGSSNSSNNIVLSQTMTDSFSVYLMYDSTILEALGHCTPPPSTSYQCRDKKSRCLSRAMHASTCPALQGLIDTAFRISQSWRIWKTIPVSRLWPGSPPKFNRLFIGPLATFPENFMQISSEVFAKSC